MRRKILAFLLAVLTVSPPLPLVAAKDRAPGFHEQSLELPGMPAAVLPADVTGDGIDDLVVLVAFTAWGEVAETERVAFDDVEGLVEVMNVVSSLVDHRELRVYPGRPKTGGFDEHLPPLELDTSVHALDLRSRAPRLLALTDEGVSAVHWSTDGVWRPHLEPLVATETVLAGTGTFFSSLRFVDDVDGDGAADLVLPTVDGWAIHYGVEAGFEPTPSVRLEIPPPPPPDEPDEATETPESDEPPELEETEIETGERDESDPEGPPPRALRQPTVQDIDRDGGPDLLAMRVAPGRGPIVWRGLGTRRFGPAVELSLAEARDREEIVHVGDLAGDGRVVAISAQEIEPDEEAGYKLWIEHAKEPDFVYRVYPLTADLTLAEPPESTFEAEGYTFSGERWEEEEEGEEEDIDIQLPGGFKDLDGNGRQDLVAITLDFSLMPLIFNVLVLRRASMRMDFRPHCQLEDGTMARVPDLDLSGKFRVNLRRVRVKHLSQFAGDFDGDGRADFVQLGRGKKVTIHLGRPGCAYPIDPDRRIKLAAEPRHLGLVRILDLDGNGLSDIYVVYPRKSRKSGESAPVRLDLYLGEFATGAIGVDGRRPADPPTTG